MKDIFVNEYVILLALPFVDISISYQFINKKNYFTTLQIPSPLSTMFFLYLFISYILFITPGQITRHIITYNKSILFITFI